MSGERAFLLDLKTRVGRPGGSVRVGIGDDCAVLRPKPAHEIMVTTDLFLEGVHFRRDWHSPESAGHRCLARGLSDLAAMGAKPMAAFLSLALPTELLRPARRANGKPWATRFFDGLLALASAHGVPLAGGDTAQSHSAGVIADIVLLGQVAQGRALLRSGARAGDILYVTGALGGSAAELIALDHHAQKQAARAGDHPQLFPQPRLAIGQALVRRRWATAAIDVSDGLSTDLDHLCDESGLAAEIDAAAIPVHALAVEAERKRRARSALALALHGGEDYELLFAAVPGARIPKAIAGVPVHAIGRMFKRKPGTPRLLLRQADGTARELQAGGWEHLRD